MYGSQFQHHVDLMFAFWSHRSQNLGFLSLPPFTRTISLKRPSKMNIPSFEIASLSMKSLHLLHESKAQSPFSGIYISPRASPVPAHSHCSSIQHPKTATKRAPFPRQGSLVHSIIQLLPSIRTGIDLSHKHIALALLSLFPTITLVTERPRP